jgi:hypothetical protein
MKGVGKLFDGGQAHVRRGFAFDALDIFVAGLYQFR